MVDIPPRCKAVAHGEYVSPSCAPPPPRKSGAPPSAPWKFYPSYATDAKPQILYKAYFYSNLNLLFAEFPRCIVSADVHLTKAEVQVGISSFPCP